MRPKTILVYRYRFSKKTFLIPINGKSIMAGTSNPVLVSGEELSARTNPTFSPVEGVTTTVNGETVEVKPPVGSADEVSEAIGSLNRNLFPEFVFEKISIPEYGVSSKCIARYTGVPVNRPDYINDYYFIGIMRMVDKLIKPTYTGRIEMTYETPSASS